MAFTTFHPAARSVITVQGPLQYECLGITDAHNHMWIDPVPGADPSAPVLDQFDSILKELIEYREKGGNTLLDCQPEGCGTGWKPTPGAFICIQGQFDCMHWFSP